MENNNSNKNPHDNFYHNSNDDPNSHDKIIENKDQTYFSKEHSDKLLNYNQIREKFENSARKEKIIQIIGFSFIVLSLFIELVIYLLARKVMGKVERHPIFRYTSIFMVLFVITIFALMQFKIISKWNKNIHTNQTNLSKSNYEILDQINLIKTYILIILILNLTFFWLFRKYMAELPEIIVTTDINRIYRAALFSARFLIVIYSIFEIWQYIRWSNRLKRIHRIENMIIDEFPNIQDLSNILE